MQVVYQEQGNNDYFINRYYGHWKPPPGVDLLVSIFHINGAQTLIFGRCLTICTYIKVQQALGMIEATHNTSMLIAKQLAFLEGQRDVEKKIESY